MTAVLCGEPNKEQATNTVCANDNIANPDNVHYVAGHHGLVVSAFLLPAVDLPFSCS